jgi:hypothetical protein
MMSRSTRFGKEDLLPWLARLAISIVFAANLLCAFSFILQPDQYTSAFELTGIAGRVVVQAFGILFLMWNATYPPVLLAPQRQMTLFAVILAQQAIGVVGETWLWLGLPPGHASLWSTGLRFVLFDGLGLVLMGIAYLLLRTTLRGADIKRG